MDSLNKMARKATGLPLTFRPLRLDDEVWAAIQRLKESHKTINEGLRVKLLPFNGEPIPSSPDEIIAHAKKAVRRAAGKWRPLDKKYRGPLLKPKERK